MEPLESRLDTASSEFAANREHLRTLVDELKQRLASAREGGGAKYVARLRQQYSSLPALMDEMNKARL